MLMRGYIFSHRLSMLITLCIALLIISAGMHAIQTTVTHGAYSPNDRYSPLHLHYSYAGQPASGGFTCQANTAPQRCYSPAQMRNAYSIQPLLNAGITGKGSTIVILDPYQAPLLQQDLKRFDKLFALADPTLNIIAPDGLTPFDAQDARQVTWSAEISLDVEWVHAIAPAASIDLVLAKSSQDTDLGSTLTYAVDKNLGDVISMSFAENATCLSTANEHIWHQAFLRATRQGITLIAASGDTGAAQTTCDGMSPEHSTAEPAVDPLVTAVGGTQLMADATTGTYQSEVGWNEPNYKVASGGGFSASLRKPFYQYGMPGIGAYRAVPDVAYNAAVNGGVLTAWSEGQRGPQAFYTFGGTSAGAPQWAAIVALGVQLSHKRLGFINPLLYIVGHTSMYTQAFHDIVTGTNTITLSGTNGVPVTIQGYHAHVGWDPVTGWGSPRVSTLLPILVALSHSYHNVYDSRIA